MLYKYQFKNVIYFTADKSSIPLGVSYTIHEIWC